MSNQNSQVNVIACNKNGVNCKDIGDNLTAVFIEDNTGKVSTYIYDRSTNKYIANGDISTEQRTNVLTPGSGYELAIDGNNITVDYRPNSGNTSQYDSIGTTYEANIGSKHLSAVVVGGIVAALVVGGTVLVFTKNPPAAGSSALGTGNVIGGAEAASVIGSLLNRLGGFLVPFLFGQNKAEAISNSFGLAASTLAPVDPLIIDLDGDGIETTGLQNGIMMDHQSDGFAELSSWVDTDDGIIVHDKNNNGIIDNGNEIFGDYLKYLPIKDALNLSSLLKFKYFCWILSSSKSFMNKSSEKLIATSLSIFDIFSASSLNKSERLYKSSLNFGDRFPFFDKFPKISEKAFSFSSAELQLLNFLSISIKSFISKSFKI